MDAGKKVVRLFTELDAVLDTRLGTLAKIDSKRAYETLENGEYFDREWDHFPRFNQAEYEAAYRERDEVTLAHSILTNVVVGLHEMCLQLRNQAMTTPHHDMVEVVINCWPYKLTEEKQHRIGLAMAHHLKSADSVKVVSLKPAELTPQMVRDDYAGMVLYDYDIWTSEHWTPETMRRFVQEGYPLVLCPDVKLIAPAIWFKEPPSARELEEIKRDNLPHPFEAMQKAMETIIDMDLVDIRFFSIPDPKAPDKFKHIVESTV